VGGWSRSSPRHYGAPLSRGQPARRRVRVRHIETAPGYTPQQIKARLGLTGDCTGQTIAIVDAYDHPAAKDDLNHVTSLRSLDVEAMCKIYGRRSKAACRTAGSRGPATRRRGSAADLSGGDLLAPYGVHHDREAVGDLAFEVVQQVADRWQVAGAADVHVQRS
jgi:hypothetical protein